MIHTLSIAASADDTDLHQWGSTFGATDGPQDNNTATTIVFPRNDLTGFGGTSQFSRGNAILRFNTEGIPDNATISAATLDIKSDTTYADTDNRSLQIEWLPNPGEISFAQYFTATPAATAKAATDLTTLAASTSYSWALLNPDTNINKTGYTGLRFHIDGAAPTGTNRIGFYSFDHATEPEPKLVVTFVEQPVFRSHPKPKLARGVAY